MNDRIGTGKHAGKKKQLPTQDSYNLNYQSYSYNWKSQSSKFGYARWSDEVDTVNAEKLTKLLQGGAKTGRVLFIDQSIGPFNLENDYSGSGADDKLVAYSSPEIKRNGDVVLLSMNVVTVKIKHFDGFDQYKFDRADRAAKLYRIASRNAETKVKLSLATYDLKKGTLNVSAPIPVDSLRTIMKLNKDHYLPYNRRGFYGEHRSYIVGLLSTIGLEVLNREHNHGRQADTMALYNNTDGSDEYRKTNARPLVIWNNGYAHSEWLRWNGGNGAWWYSLPKKSGGKSSDVPWTRFRLSDDQFFSALKLSGKMMNSFMVKPMLVLPGLSPKAVAHGPAIEHFMENKFNNLSGAMRNYSAMVAYTLNSKLDAEKQGDYEKKRLEENLKRRVYNMPMGVFDFSVSARVPVMILKSPIKLADDMTQRLLAEMVQSAMDVGEKPELRHMITYGMRNMMRNGTYKLDVTSAESNLESLHGFYTETYAYDENKKLINPLHSVEKKSVRELNKYEMKDILEAVELPAARENRFW